MLRRNGPVVKSVESVLRLEGSLWRERFVEEVGLLWPTSFTRMQRLLAGNDTVPISVSRTW